MRLFSNKERQLLLSLLEAKIAINKSYIQLREKDAEICKSICTMTGGDPSKLINVDEILLELAKQTSMTK
jgi:hypothetical protein